MRLAVMRRPCRRTARAVAAGCCTLLTFALHRAGAAGTQRSPPAGGRKRASTAEPPSAELAANGPPPRQQKQPAKQQQAGGGGAKQQQQQEQEQEQQEEEVKKGGAKQQQQPADPPQQQQQQQPSKKRKKNKDDPVRQLTQSAAALPAACVSHCAPHQLRVRGTGHLAVWPHPSCMRCKPADAGSLSPPAPPPSELCLRGRDPHGRQAKPAGGGARGVRAHEGRGLPRARRRAVHRHAVVLRVQRVGGRRARGARSAAAGAAVLRCGRGGLVPVPDPLPGKHLSGRGGRHAAQGAAVRWVCQNLLGCATWGIAPLLVRVQSSAGSLAANSILPPPPPRLASP
jgi:hypothetical protein